MRVLAVGSVYPPHDMGGGYEITWRSSVDHLRARGDDVRVLASDFRLPGDVAPDDPDAHRELRWYWRDHAFPRLAWRERRALERHNAAVLDRHLAEFRPDAVCWWAMGGMSLSLVQRAGVPAVGVVGDEWMVYGPRVARLRRTRIDLSAPLWLFNSAHTRQASLDAGWDLPRTRVAHPGVDHGLFRPAAGPAPAAAWSGELLYVGRLDERKGAHVAVQALERLPETTTLTLQGSGDPAYVASLERERVRFSSEPRDRLPSIYAAADAVLFPVQWHEPWGLVPLEAMAVGRPVIATGTGGSAEYLRHEENCLIHEPADSAEALAAAVERLAADPVLRARLREGGLATAARYTDVGYNDAIAAALDEVTGR
jgi:glycosyltransferase involved in cell wall biosynthesis